MDEQRWRTGCAGWGIPTAKAEEFPGEGTHLARYARRFRCVEINSSFYRPHQRRTYERWAASVPEDFRFAVKFPRQVTHLARLRDADAAIDAFAEQVDGLGGRLGVVLVQLPPSLAFDGATADAFFASLRRRVAGAIVCEPRHATWFAPALAAFWERHRVGRVAADPARMPLAAAPGGAGGVAYWRLHGSPRIYYDAYGEARLAPWAAAMQAARSRGSEVWAILDNTAAGHAIDDAMMLERLLSGQSPRKAPQPS